VPHTAAHSLPAHGASPYCWLAMSLVVCVMPPPMPQQAVSLALGTTLGCGGEGGERRSGRRQSKAPCLVHTDNLALAGGAVSVV
jgi:hypothetical protein